MKFPNPKVDEPRYLLCHHHLVSGESKKVVTCLISDGLRSLWPIFKTKMLICLSKANLDENTLFGKITHHLDPEISKMLVRGTFHSKRTLAEF